MSATAAAAAAAGKTLCRALCATHNTSSRLFPSMVSEASLHFGSESAEVQNSVLVVFTFYQS